MIWTQDKNARHGHSSTHITHALIYLKRAIPEVVDSGNFSAWSFYADFTKGFNIIDHNILLNELDSLKTERILPKLPLY